MVKQQLKKYIQHRVRPWCWILFHLAFATSIIPSHAGSEAIAQDPSRHFIGISSTVFLQSAVHVVDYSGQLLGVNPRPSYGANLGFRYRYILRDRSDGIGFEIEASVFRANIKVSFPELILETGEVIAPFNETAHPGFMSRVIWSGSVHYSRFLTHGIRRIEASVGMGITKSGMLILNSSLGYATDSIHRGAMALDLGFLSRYAPIFRLGVDLVNSKVDNGWRVGVIANVSGPYITGGYILMPNTPYESEGSFKGGINYLGIRLSYMIAIRQPSSDLGRGSKWIPVNGSGGSSYSETGRGPTT